MDATIGQNKQPLRIPVSLHVTAYLMLLWGLLAVAEVLSELGNHHIDFNLSLLYVPAGIGSLRLNRGWRICALVLNAVLFVFVVWGMAVAHGANKPLEFSVLGRQCGWLPPAMLWWIVLPFVGSVAFTSWALLRSRYLFDLPLDQRQRALKVRPGAAMAIATIILAAGGLMELGFWHVSAGYPVWVYASEVRTGGPIYGAEQTWSEVARWSTDTSDASTIRDDRTYDLTAEASWRGEIVARRQIEIRMVVDQENGRLMLVEMRDVPGSIASSRFAICSTFRWYSTKISHNPPYLDAVPFLNHEFALVTTDWDHSKDVVFWPNENAVSRSASTQGIIPGTCPRVSLYGSWIYPRGEFKQFAHKAVPYVGEVHASGVVRFNTPAGMFPGQVQPIEWNVIIKPRDPSVPTLHFLVPAGDYRPNASSSPTDF